MSKRLKYDTEELRRLYYDDCMSCAEIAAHIGSGGRHSVSRKLREAGFTLRRKGPRRGRMPAGDCHWNWRGGRCLDAAGYVHLWRPGHPCANSSGYVLEHRLVASESRGRPVQPDEEVHHINGVKDDNRPENLLVVPKAKHKQLHADHCREVWELRKRVEQLESQINRGHSLKVIA